MRRKTVVLGFVAVMACASVSVLMYRFKSPYDSRGTLDESVINTLWTLAVAQAEFADRVYVDVNGDGAGEFGTLQELAGTGGLRLDERGRTRGDFIRSPLVRMEMGCPDGSGIVTSKGYYFLLYLPTSDRSATHEGFPNSQFVGTVDPSLSAKWWCAYAWPSNVGSAGNGVFFVDASGRVWSADAGEFYGRRPLAPEWYAAMSWSSNRKWALDGGQLHEGQDGRVWVLRREP